MVSSLPSLHEPIGMVLRSRNATLLLLKAQVPVWLVFA